MKRRHSLQLNGQSDPISFSEPESLQAFGEVVDGNPDYCDLSPKKPHCRGPSEDEKERIRLEQMAYGSSETDERGISCLPLRTGVEEDVMFLVGKDGKPYMIFHAGDPTSTNIYDLDF